DLFGDNTTAIKAHYGRYYDQLRITDAYPAMDIPDLRFYFWDWDAEEYFFDFTEPVGSARVDPDLKQPGVDQYSLSIERELIKDLSVEVAVIYKKFINILGCVETNGQWEPATYFDEYTGETYDVWSLITDPEEAEYLITNPVGGTYDTVPFTPEAKYLSFQVNLTKRFSNKWQLMASYAYSKADGNYDLGGWGGRELLGNEFFISKNETLNSEGYNLSDTTHVFKLQGSVILPFDIALGVNFIYRSGYRYNNLFRIFDDDIIDVGWTRDIRAESRGSLKYPDLYRLDLRLEKQFKIGKNTFSVLLDAYNLFNSNTILETQNHTYNPNYGKISSIMTPRRFQLGIRFHFK
ncbi:MAG: hypothetical protein KAS65_01485, partial [Candidatus Aminicenantes bacterium]|nr:hypothetical protein [Candidatus Aminicenantes bacterium]